MNLLPVLAVRFDRFYKCGLGTEWKTFDNDTEIVENILASTSPLQFANEVTISDQADFDLLCPKDFKAGSAHMDYMSRKWNTLCDSINECCTALPLRQFLQEVLGVSGGFLGKVMPANCCLSSCMI